MGFTSFIDKYQKIVERYPHHTALKMGEKSYTHLDMWEQASSNSHLLSDLPVGSRVGIHIPKSFDLVAAILGCWMRGLICIPLDPSLPPKRLEQYIDDVQPHRILSSNTGFFTHSICYPIPTFNTTPSALVQLSATDGAYIIYSSGSTGSPKGILVSHQGLLPVLEQQISVLELTPKDRCLWFLSMQFDASISDIGVSLLSGATLIISKYKDLRKSLHEYSITYVDMPPVLLGAYSPQQFPSSLRCILIGGEPCSHPALELHRQHRRIVVVYGPTESTICTSLVVCDEQHGCTENSIGTPLEGVEYHIENGELWIAGKMLAIGYWNRPALHNKWIISNTKRFFRTGDSVTYNGKEYIFSGRMDRQFKLHGKLIAPEEIEQILCTQDDVQRAYVCLHEHQLFAFIESNTTSDFSTFMYPLHEKIPDWMIPKHGLVLDIFPTLPSGKIDSHMLKSRITVSTSPHFWCALFSTVLHKPVQIHDNFFELGGDSIAMMALLVLAQKQGLQLTPEQLRKAPTPHLLYQKNHLSLGLRVASLQAFVDKEIINIPNTVHQTSNKTIYITGATGFLGSKILSILCAKGFRPRILVRANSLKHARERIPTLYREQVDIFVGDVIDKKSISTFLGTGEGILFHCAASLSLGSSLDDLYSINVRACTELFSYPKLKIAYASTLAFMLTNDEEKGFFLEKPMTYSPETRIFGGYSQSKWIAEQLAIHRQALVFRFGLLVDDQTLPKNDWFFSFIRGLVQIGTIPQGIQHSVYLDMTPLSYAAQAFVDITLTSNRGIYHIASPKSVSLKEICLALESLGHPIRECEQKDWFHSIDQANASHDLHVVRLSFQAVLEENTHTPQLNMFLATGAKFDDTHVQQTVGRQSPIPTLHSIRSVLRNILENT